MEGERRGCVCDRYWAKEGYVKGKWQRKRRRKNGGRVKRRSRRVVDAEEDEEVYGDGGEKGRRH